MVIVGIDPGTTKAGYGVVEKTGSVLACLDYGLIQVPKAPTQSSVLLHMEQGISRLLKLHKPKMLVIEKLFFMKNAKTAMAVSEARGVILLQAAKQKIPVCELTPLQAKMAITGYGRADKKQVSRMVQQCLGLKDAPKPDDAADALGFAIAFAYSKKL